MNFFLAFKKIERLGKLSDEHVYEHSDWNLYEHLSFFYNVMRCPHPNCFPHQEGMCGVLPM